MKSMGERIREKRKEINLSQYKLSQMVGVNRVTLTGWESDQYQPNGANLQSLAEALQCDPVWLVSGKGSQGAKIRPKPEVFNVKKVPLVSWVQAGAWTTTEPGVKESDATEWVYTTALVSDNAFALRVRGDSMTAVSNRLSIPEGSVIIVEPEINNTIDINGKIVVAYIDGGVQATLKKFVEDWPHRYLVPLNPAYITIECDENCRIVGLVKQVVMDF
ncbi:S24 family peptidase [uncultured Serratia sp.]|uniref:LexA family protein n=1 Tax=uncultured Serratia sp. TaxID=239175 RepID=UPI00258AB469|nr:S24 family peptidase [uncultured Serratia sp.]